MALDRGDPECMKPHRGPDMQPGVTIDSPGWPGTAAIERRGLGGNDDRGAFAGRYSLDRASIPDRGGLEAGPGERRGRISLALDRAPAGAARARIRIQLAPSKRESRPPSLLVTRERGPAATAKARCPACRWSVPPLYAGQGRQLAPWRRRGGRSRPTTTRTRAIGASRASQGFGRIPSRSRFLARSIAAAAVCQ